MHLQQNAGSTPCVPSLRRGMFAVAIFLAVFSRDALATSYYIAPNGSDSNTGKSSSAPFKTFSKANSVVVAGDVVNVSGGTYYQRPRFTRGGRSGQLVTYRAVPGATVIIDGQGGSEDAGGIAGNFIELENLIFQNGGRYGLLITGDDNVIDRVTTRYSQGNAGLRTYQADRNTITDSWSYGNWDKSMHGENADGFQINGNNNILTRCLSFQNSDDGFDAWESIGTVFEACMAYDNGYDSNGDGNGFKLSNLSNGKTMAMKNISFDNLRRGFTSNGGGGHSFINNTGVNNPYNFQNSRPGTNFVNNLSVGGKVDMNSSPTMKNNSWNLAITDPKFQSTDRASSVFLRLSSSSPAINKGVNMGLYFLGSAPDLGAFELK